MASTTPSSLRSFNRQRRARASERPFTPHTTVRKMDLSFLRQPATPLISPLGCSSAPCDPRRSSIFSNAILDPSSTLKFSEWRHRETEKRHSYPHWCRAPTEPSHEEKEGCKLVVKNVISIREVGKTYSPPRPDFLTFSLAAWGLKINGFPKYVRVSHRETSLITLYGIQVFPILFEKHCNS